MNTHPELALLAPVPFVFLEEGASLCRKRGKVAFASRAWELFRELDSLREGMPVEAFIYASQQGAGTPAVTWHGHYIGSVESQDGAHPEGRRYRPPFTVVDGEDKAGYWAVFWEVASLKSIDPIGMSEFAGWKTEKRYKSSFIPEGPLIVWRP